MIQFIPAVLLAAANFARRRFQMSFPALSTIRVWALAISGTRIVMNSCSMMHHFRLSLLTLGLLHVAVSDSAGQTIRFSQQVRPILSDRCYVCHGPDETQRAADLRLDISEGLNRVIVSGDPDSSDLIQRLESRDEDFRMPPAHSKLSVSREEVALVREWISQGGTWEPHWSFTSIERVAPPPTKNHALTHSPIDAFILARLEQEGLSLAPLAAKETLMRRVSLDLTGLAPTLEELDAYLSDDAPDAYERLVDRLLASPRFGERMASQWLDLARYSDTYGYQVDQDRFVWPWRDWVVRAFNANQPFDQFALEQIAGDLLPSPTDDQILATTFNRLHPQKVEGGSIEEEFRVEYVADRLHTFGTAFLGLTVECARCHDHKFDPFSMAEYYQLFAFFNNIDEAGLCSYFDPDSVPPPALALMDDARKERLRVLHQNVELAEQELRNLVEYLSPRQFNPADPSFGRDNAASEKGLPPNAFGVWLADREARKNLSELEKTRLSQSIPISSEMVGRNTLGQSDDGIHFIRFTGDDEVKINGGKFQRQQPFSILARIRITPAEDGQPIKRAVLLHCSRAWTDSASRGYQLLIEDGRVSAALIHFWPGNAICVKTTELIPVEQWLDLVMTYDGSSSADGLRIYLDGELQPTSVVRDGLTRTILGNGTDHLIAGARFRDMGFVNGRMADLQCFTEELTKLEIEQRHDRVSLVQLLNRTQDDLTVADLKALFDYYLARCCAEVEQARNKVQAVRAELYAFQDAQPSIMVMRESPGIRQTFLLARGAYDALQSQVTANTPAMLPQLNWDQSRQANRLDLANWLIDQRHPLTARVAVNQYWQMLFGVGLVRTPEDFGSQSLPPTHWELLDWLAADFQQDWDIKRCLKQMVMSRTYQQTSRIDLQVKRRDPANVLISRAPVFRLTAEMLRDNLLLQSGLLVEQKGGPPVRPYDLELAFAPVKRDSGDALYRRSLYTYWKRTATSPAMVVLDAPNRDVCRVNRDRTTSPLQGLLLLNGTQFVEASRALSEKTLVAHGNEPAQVAQTIFRSLTSRRASEQELTVLLHLFRQQHERYLAEPKLANELISVGDSKSNYQDKIELAAWTTVANMLMNFEEVTHRY
jgi:hypothetical protein